MDSPILAHRPSPQAHPAAFGPSLANAGPLQNAFAAASQTQTQTRSPTSPQTPILRLRGAPPSTGRSVSWSEDVIDNEGMNKKSSKVCCIYHRPKTVDESSDESSSDSTSDSDSSSDSDPHRDSEDGDHPSAASRHMSRSRRRPAHPHAHDHHEVCNHDHASTGTSSGNTASPSGAASTTTTTTTGQMGRTSARPRRRPSPNAYEKMPRPTNLAGGMPPQSRY